MGIEEFKEEIEQFLIEHDELTPTVFGKKFASDPLFVFQIRDGREPRSATVKKVLDGMSSYKNTPEKISA